MREQRTGVVPLNHLAQRANAEHHAFLVTQKAAVQHAIAAGEALLEAKSNVDHGQWLPWIAEHCDFGERTARRYMQIARNRSRVTDLSSIRDALAWLAGEAELVPKPRPAMQYSVSAPGLLDEKRVDDADPVRGLFAWMVPWEADCPNCGCVRVTPKPQSDAAAEADASAQAAPKEEGR